MLYTIYESGEWDLQNHAQKCQLRCFQAVNFGFKITTNVTSIRTHVLIALNAVMNKTAEWIVSFNLCDKFIAFIFTRNVTRFCHYLHKYNAKWKYVKAGIIVFRSNLAGFWWQMCLAMAECCKFSWRIGVKYSWHPKVGDFSYRSFFKI